MNHFKTLLLFGLFIVFYHSSFAQDKIIFKTGEILDVWIIEKTKTQVKFKKLDDELNLYVTDLSEILEIIKQPETKYLYVTTDDDPFKKTAINIGSIWTFDYYGLVQFERMLKPGLSMVGEGLGGYDLLAFSAGVRGYLFSKSSSPLKLYGGIMPLFDTNSGGLYLQMPIGVNVVSKNGFDLKLGLKIISELDYWEIRPAPELMVGWRF